MFNRRGSFSALLVNRGVLLVLGLLAFLFMLSTAFAAPVSQEPQPGLATQLEAETLWQAYQTRYEQDRMLFADDPTSLDAATLTDLETLAQGPLRVATLVVTPRGALLCRPPERVLDLIA